MSKNTRYKIFHEKNADNKLKLLLAIQKFNPSYSELLTKISIKAKEAKLYLSQLEESGYVVKDIHNHYMCNRPLPSSSDIKVYRYILRHNPAHSPMLRSINNLDAKHIIMTLSKLQKDGLLHFDIKTGKYSIAIQEDNIIHLVMNHYNNQDGIKQFISKFRNNIREYDRYGTNSLRVFLGTFFDFALFQEKHIDLLAWFYKNGYDSVFTTFTSKELYSKIVEQGKTHPNPFWREIDKYLLILDDESVYYATSDVLNEDIEQMDEQDIVDIISAMPTFRNKNEFAKALEQKIFNGYQYMLTIETSYIEEHHYDRTIINKLLKYHQLYYPENVIIEIYTDALKEYNDFRKRQRDIDNPVHFKTFCTEEIFGEMQSYCNQHNYDFDKLYKLVQQNKRVFSGKSTKRMKECLSFMLQHRPTEIETKALKIILSHA